ncbi:hypothetical protein BLNAU_6637 [Blattamonas nauphoetae]|uniref:Secreted protein n=1 Tax=Blattamonas nauphoetae TaxID=2049346 RepID=A0ABQ9Y3N9_9EUKA|nr:hypothetical protein BLNAU_6637 [Blattamonas nauphoetae]
MTSWLWTLRVLLPCSLSLTLVSSSLFTALSSISSASDTTISKSPNSPLPTLHSQPLPQSHPLLEPCTLLSLPPLHRQHHSLVLHHHSLLFTLDSPLIVCSRCCFLFCSPMHEVSEGDDGRFPDRIVVTSQTTWQAAMSAVSVGLSFCTLPCSLVQPPPKSVNNNLVHPSSSVGVVLAMSEGQAAIDCGVVGEIDEKRQQASSPTASTCGC